MCSDSKNLKEQGGSLKRVHTFACHPVDTVWTAIVCLVRSTFGRSLFVVLQLMGKNIFILLRISKLFPHSLAAAIHFPAEL